MEPVLKPSMLSYNLEDLDDTQDVFHNGDIPEQVLEEME